MPVAAVQRQPASARLRGRVEAEDLLLSPGARTGVLCFAIRRFHLILNHYGCDFGDRLLDELWVGLRRDYPGLAGAGFRWSAGSLVVAADAATLDAMGTSLPSRLLVAAPQPLSAGSFGVTVRRFDQDGFPTRRLIEEMDRFVALPAAG